MIFIFYLCFLFVHRNAELKKDSVKQDGSHVITLLKAVPHFDGFLIKKDKSFIYAGGWNGTVVGRIKLSGKIRVEVKNLSGPVYVHMDRFNNLFVSNFTNDQLIKISSNGNRSVYADNLDAPAPILSDAKGDLLVGNYGKNYRGNSIVKIFKNGKKTSFIKDDRIFAPIGLVFGNDSSLYIGNQGDGKILKYMNGTLYDFAALPSKKINHMVFLKGNLYATSIVDNRVYKINMMGIVSVFAGSGAYGNNDGPVHLATFKAPNGLSTDGENLYVADNIDDSNNLQNIRMIVLD